MSAFGNKLIGLSLAAQDIGVTITEIAVTEMQRAELCCYNYDPNRQTITGAKFDGMRLVLKEEEPIEKRAIDALRRAANAIHCTDIDGTKLTAIANELERKIK